jgi:hypothetical protein
VNSSADQAAEGDEPVIEPEEAYRRLFEAHPVPMAIWDPSTGRILAANDAALVQYGYQQADMVGLPVDRLVHPDDLPRLLARVLTLPQGFAGAEPFRHVRSDGTTLEVEMSGHPIDFEGRPARLVLATDVTDRRRLEEQLRQSQKMEAVGRLAGGIAHDFNNLLMAIMGFGELLLEQLAEGSEEREAAEEIQRAAQRAAALTAQLLAFSRPRSVQPEAIDLNELLVAMGPMLSRILGSHINVRVEADADRPYILADRGQIEQTLVACAVNARDAMPDGGRVTLRSDDVSSVAARALGGIVADGPHVMVSVSDTGTGMDADVRDRAFDPFFTTKPSGGTTGLGLAMAYSAIQHAGGRVRLESTPGRGSTVRIFLPTVDAPHPVVAAATRVAESAPGLPATILVAEDEPAVRAFVEQVLRGAGHSVIATPDGIAAIDAAARHEGPIDLLLTDIVMPGPSGIETARRLRSERPGIRVLFMSGWAADALRREGLDEAAVALLPKPFSVAELIARVTAVLAEPAPDD